MKFPELNVDSSDMLISVPSVFEVIEFLLNGMACDTEGITAGHLKDAEPWLCTLLALIFTSVHSYVPCKMMSGTCANCEKSKRFEFEYSVIIASLVSVCKLIDRGAPLFIVHTLLYWYR